MKVFCSSVLCVLEIEAGKGGIVGIRNMCLALHQSEKSRLSDQKNSCPTLQMCVTRDKIQIDPGSIF